jgi:hypothetical protein
MGTRHASISTCGTVVEHSVFGKNLTFRQEIEKSRSSSHTLWLLEFMTLFDEGAHHAV